MLRRSLWILVGLVSVASAAQPVPVAPASPLAWPAVQRDMKPWTRWWWLGDIADEKSITAEMESYAAAGIGGLELTPIYGVRGYEDRFVPFLSPRWMQLFRHVLAEGQRLGLGIDLANGTGWPFGGPWLAESDTAHTLYHRTFSVDAGSSLAEPVTLIAPPLLRFAGPKRVPIESLQQPITANPNLQELAVDQVRFAQPLTLSTLMAYPEKGDPIDLTSQVGANGMLTWKSPADQGRWSLYAVFSGPHGKMVERAAPAAEGYALDHFSHVALQHYLAHFDEAFSGQPLTGLRGFFNDSYEVDDAQGEGNFTTSFFDEFQRRRGYDLRRHLPDLFSEKPGDTAVRVISDYRETVSDLLRDEFTSPWRTWAKRHGAIIRNQAHGSPALILDLYAASDIPEQEGGDILAIKLASSAAHLTGKPLASAETGTWLNEHFLSTLGELKHAVDTFLLGGINHNCYHGTAFSPLGEEWPGFQFYASVELNPRNPFWNDFAQLNSYVARAQSWLQSGEPDEDVLLYYNIHDRWAVPGDGSMPHFNGGERDGVGARATAGKLREAGIGFDYVSDRLLAAVQANGNAVVSGKTSYRAIVIPPTHFMPEATLARLIDLAEKGTTVVVIDRLPEEAPGLHPKGSNFKNLLNRLGSPTANGGGFTRYRVGRGQFLVGADPSGLLASPELQLIGEPMVSSGLEFVRRRTPQGKFYFIANRTSAAIDRWVRLSSPGQTAVRYDLMTGEAGEIPLRAGNTAAKEIRLQLAPGESTVVQLSSTPRTLLPPWPYWQTAGEPEPMKGEWSVQFLRGGPSLPAAQKINALASWTNFSTEGVRAFSGTASYTLSFAQPTVSAGAWQLDLGRIADSARVRLNGQEIAVLIQPPWRVVIPSTLLRAQNELVVEVTNLAANRIADLDRRGVPWKKFYNTNMPARRRENTGPDHLFSAAGWSPRDSGLLGPVTLTPLNTPQAPAKN